MPEALWCERSDLRAGGMTGIDIDGALRRGARQRVARGVYLPAAVATDLWQRSGAALSTQHPDAAVSRRTAAIAHDFPWIPDHWRSMEDVCVDAPRDDLTRSSRSGLDRRLSALPPEDVTTWRGLRICTPARTAVDLARYEPRGLVVPILDGVLTQRLCTADEMQAVMDRMVRVPNVRRARQLVGLAREGVDSPRETHTRLHIVDAGLPEPDVNLQIVENDIVLAQGDLGYWRWLIWIEYDGQEVHEPQRVWGSDQSKDRWLGRRGWEIFRLTNRDHHRPTLWVAQLASAIRDAPARIAALDPRRSPEVAAARALLGLT